MAKPSIGQSRVDHCTWTVITPNRTVAIICIICPKPKRRARGHAARAVTVLVPPLTARPLSAASAEWKAAAKSAQTA